MDFKIQSNWRIGKPKDDNTPRLLSVTIDREYMISNILKATKSLQTVTDPIIKNTSIFRDLIKEDREQRKKLVQEMKSRNEALKSQTDPETGLAITDRWIIRGDKLAFVDKDNKLKSV